MTPEGKIQKKILDYLNGLDCCKAIKVMRANEAGTPDIFCVWRGNPILLEVKRDADHAHWSIVNQPTQEIRLLQWRDAGARAARVWSVEQVETLLGRIRL